jgi:hypothetical protein
MSKYNTENWSITAGVENMDTFDTKHVVADGRKVYNFCAGPCVLPKAVLDRAA